MKAILYNRYGTADVLHVGEVERPTPRGDEILIRVCAAEATKSDCEMRSFDFQVKWFTWSLRIMLGISKPKKQILGGYFSGVVEEVGENVSRFSKGDEVFGCARLRLGAYGQFMCLPANFTIVPKPSNVNFKQASAIPLGGLNALHFMRRANISKGEKVLINGAGGSIGVYGVQIAKAFGAEVTAIDSAIKEEMLRRIGADHFIDYAKEDFTKAGQTYDVIFSMVAKSSFSPLIKALNPGGRYLMANPKISDMLRGTLISALTDKKVVFAFAGEKEEELLTLKEMIEDGKIAPIVDKVYTMEQAAAAHRRVEAEERLGSTVIIMANEDKTCQND
jgi:NADPH:quinone reductase-like Zn-dependent oxidoreductase